MRLHLILLLLFTSVFMVDESRATSLKLLWETEGFAGPESVLSVKNHPWLYVSNTNGQNEGFISRLSKTGEIDKLKWASSLMSPTGMGLLGNDLYVADYKFVRVIDIKTGKIKQSITAKSVSMLNDITVGETGRVFVSDILGGKIYEVTEGKLLTWFESEHLPHPNGLLLDNNTLIVANLGAKLSQNPTSEEYGSAFKVNLKTKAISMINASYKLGGLDGVVPFEDGVLISHFPAGEIYKVNSKERVLIGTVDVSSADIGIDQNSKALYIPFLLKNKVSAYVIDHAQID